MTDDTASTDTVEYGIILPDVVSWLIGFNPKIEEYSSVEFYSLATHAYRMFEQKWNIRCYLIRSIVNYKNRYVDRIKTDLSTLDNVERSAEIASTIHESIHAMKQSLTFMEGYTRMLSAVASVDDDIARLRDFRLNKLDITAKAFFKGFDELLALVIDVTEKSSLALKSLVEMRIEVNRLKEAALSSEVWKMKTLDLAKNYNEMCQTCLMPILDHSKLLNLENRSLDDPVRTESFMVLYSLIEKAFLEITIILEGQKAFFDAIQMK